MVGVFIQRFQPASAQVAGICPDQPLLHRPPCAGIATGEPPANPSPWLADKLWAEMCRLSDAFEPFKGLADSFKCGGEGVGGEGSRRGR